MDARLKGCPVRPESTLEFGVPIGPILVNDFLEDSLENLVCGLGQTVRLRVVRRAFLMYSRVVCGEFTNKGIEKMPALVSGELYWTFKTEPYVFVNGFGHGPDCVVAKCLGLYPFCIVVSYHDDIFMPGPSRGQSERVDKIQSPLLEKFQWEDWLVRHACLLGRLSHALT